MVIVGTTPFAREARQWIEDCGLEIVCFIDPHADSSTLDGLPVKKNFEGLANFKYFCGEVGADIRELTASVAESNGLIPCMPIIHPSATISDQVTLEPGVLVCPNATLSPYVTVRRGGVVGTEAYVPVEATIEAFNFSVQFKMKML